MQQEKIHSYKELTVWQKAKNLSICVYKLTKKFPPEEMYGITSQMRRSAISIASNIAEGRSRGTRKDFLQFLRTAYGSGAELETQLEISKELSLGNITDYNETASLLNEVMRMLKSMIIKLNPKLTKLTEAPRS